MGQRTLKQFREILEFNLGNRGLDAPQLDLWINDGLLDLTSSVDFRNLENAIELKFNSTSTATIPDHVVNIRFIQDASRRKLLDPLPEVEFLRRPLLDYPTHWSRFGTDIRVNAIVRDDIGDDPDVIVAFVREEHPLLVDDEDKTKLPQAWDLAITYLSTHHGFLVLGEEELSAVWLSRAISYIQSRMTDEDMESSLSGTALINASGMRALMTRLQNLQQTGN